MFWGLVLEPSKKYTQKVDQTFHISQAALDLKSCDLEPIQLVVEYENSNFVLATLSKKANIFQVPLDLIFKTGDEISFRTIGNGKVHLSGYHVLEDIDSMIMNGEEESDVDEAEEEIVKSNRKRGKLTPGAKGNKKAKLDDTNEEDSDDIVSDEEDEDLDDEDEDDDSEEENEQIVTEGKKENKRKPKNDISLMSMDLDEEDDDELNNEDDEEEESELDESENFESFEGEPKGKAQKSKNKKLPQTPNGMTPDSKGKNLASQKQNKNKKQKALNKEAKTLKSGTKPKVEKSPGSAESSPQRKKPESAKKEAKLQKSPKSPKSPKSEESPQKKVLEGGVISEEIRVGSGPIAKPGKMVNVYYVGTLGSTKKEFDSVQSGGGFKFRLGRNEVIKGWDIGLVGMKVGGKRKLTIPPHLAYGSKGSPPVIPPNSTLVFNVELKGLS